MAQSFGNDLVRGLRNPVRYRLGDGVNVWGAKINDCMARLDSLSDEIAPAVATVLRELFEEIGQQTTDSFAAIHEARGQKQALPSLIVGA